ncbi:MULTISPECIES: diaminopimelate epimerase [Chryseobacterium]|uniref:Diaminopimelate epimerase n=1 Tax=Chryseobacterium camelliae TaxID=1265445 RepID=A0ABU0TFA1_9FLAO|nr:MULTISPECIES: diaminopimelate epimerase [Chryseobacterium]MDT3406467.1 diaminopimelate epimerase [Pseudacidovorax intermedius]MDQ1095734.1 diaminopimelate epimerase [Chryseobacterium camelliae]MDQ1099670.1 diaminopimelate epimerase [Chryseobacterium sp. SORGH_AS_1048]MDR6087019.1 diaminopimelate epimerase [Chryseobacterium sp. SORGH_AS_0909]MDR6131391.1 diaminopimelate epimerase [Chryseobacterium sp. SORGH_AS_1175]
MEFYKYQGTGNDFVMIDNRSGEWDGLEISDIRKLCDRRFGIGADGLIKINTAEGYDFEVDYYNSDGSKSFCGNGARCSVAFAFFLDMFEGNCKFVAIDGPHEAEIHNGIVKLKMSDVEVISADGGDMVMDTGSPHYVKYVEDLINYNVFAEGKGIRNSDNYREKGINVNFVEKTEQDEIFVRTYERGVEDETYSCGTGVTAAALTFMQKNNLISVKVKTLGGNLAVHAEKDGNSFRNIWLEGPAKQVFKGKINLI